MMSRFLHVVTVVLLALPGCADHTIDEDCQDEEVCGDGVDNDCDNLTDEDCACEYMECGGVCCNQGEACHNDSCCLPSTCQQQGKECGRWPDGCGDEVDCGSCLGGGACNSDGRCVTGNQQPSAVVGPDQAVCAGDVAMVSGENSSDPDGDPLSFQWTMRSRPTDSQATLQGADTSVVQFAADVLGTFVLELVVNDGNLDSYPAVAVVNSLRRPVADAGVPQYVQVGTQVSLDGGNSYDPEGFQLEYAWTLTEIPQGSSATIDAPDGMTPGFVADVAGTYEAELIVSHGLRVSDPDVVYIIATLERPDGLFDPGQVYIFGTLSPGSCGRDAIAHWSDPNDPVVGFDCYADERGAVIRPVDGRVIYTNVFEDLIREYHCDGCPDWAPGDAYPSGVLDNDTILPSPPCDPDSNRMVGFLVAPDSGEILHTCSGVWYDHYGNEVYTDTDALIHLGANQTALTGNAIVDLTGGPSTAVVGLPSGSPLTIRALPDGGFWLVMNGSSGEGDDQELWLVEADGTASLVGSYPPPPADHSVRAYMSRLDVDGKLFQFAMGPVTFEDTIICRTIGGTSQVVYTEADDPVVQLHISSLLTGP